MAPDCGYGCWEKVLCLPEIYSKRAGGPQSTEDRPRASPPFLRQSASGMELGMIGAQNWVRFAPSSCNTHFIRAEMLPSFWHDISLRFYTVLGSQRVGHDWATELNWTGRSLISQFLKMCFREQLREGRDYFEATIFGHLVLLSAIAWEGQPPSHLLFLLSFSLKLKNNYSTMHRC